MAKQTINIGSTANDGTGSTLRVGGDLINDNFNEIYTVLGSGSALAFDITGVTNGQALIYNSSSSKFEAAAANIGTVTSIIAGTGLSGGTITASGTIAIDTATTVDKATAQTLTNKTLTSPKINENVVMSSTATELNLLDGATVTTAEINKLDGDTSATSTTLADADRLVVNDAGTIVQVAMSDVKTYLNTAGYVTDDPTALAIALG